MTVSLAITAPQAEFRVARALEQRAIPHRIFKIRKQLAFRGRPVERILPAFPRYIFLRILFDEIYHHLLEPSPTFRISYEKTAQYGAVSRPCSMIFLFARTLTDFS